MSDLMKRTSKEADDKRNKKFALLVVFLLTKWEVSIHEAIQTVLPMPMRHSNNDVVYIPAVVKKFEYEC